ncbi:MAG: PQQ-like beta-propeller repeat protein [Anaerolineales bacterium]|nr:PQQ-like beta-propeller repeat protein [Anaerolineales bacterium]
MRAKSFAFLAALTAFILAACGAAPSQTWPGLTTNGEVAYVASGQQVHAVRVADGVQVWAFPAEVNNNTGVFVADPGVSADLILVGSEGPTNSYSGVLYGLDPATGAQKWCLAFDQKGADRATCPLAQGAPSAGLFGIAPAVDNRVIGGLALVDGVAYVGLSNGKFYAVDAATGRDQWMFETKRDVWAVPLVLGDTVYVSSLDHHLYALNTANGALRWQKDLGAALAGTPTPSEDGRTLYVGTFGNLLYALDAQTGEPVWAQPYTAQNWVWAGPTRHAGVLYLTDVGGYIHAIDEATGQAVWAAPVKPGGLMRARPAIADGVLYVGDRDGKLFGLDPATGAVLHTATLKGQILAPILVVQDKVLVAPFSGDNLLAGFSLDLQSQPLAFAPTK